MHKHTTNFMVIGVQNWGISNHVTRVGHITMKFIYLSRVLRPLNIKGRTQTRPLSCGFDSSVGRALHRKRKGRGLESRLMPEFFQVIFPVVLWLYSHLSFLQQIAEVSNSTRRHVNELSTLTVKFHISADI